MAENPTLLRPYGVVIDGVLQLGLELVLLNGAVLAIRPHTGLPEPFVVSPAFVNAHSHLEYRGLQGKLQSSEYWPWIREITQAKAAQSLDQVEADCLLAAQENVTTGVALVAEHSDRPFSERAMEEAGLEGMVYHEVIDRFGDSDQRLQAAQARLESSPIPAGLALHAYQTVRPQTIAHFAQIPNLLLSIHVAETDAENQLTRDGTGEIAEFFRQMDIQVSPTGKRLVPTLADLGLTRSLVQFVHCCAVDANDIEIMAQGRVTVAHCPRSNERLNCPPAPVEDMLEAGIPVGLGLDSPASSGPIDMFAEMQAAMRVSQARGRGLDAETVWRMASDIGRKSVPSLGSPSPWGIYEGSTTPLIELHIPGAECTEDLIERGEPRHVRRINR